MIQGYTGITLDTLLSETYLICTIFWHFALALSSSEWLLLRQLFLYQMEPGQLSQYKY